MNHKVFAAIERYSMLQPGDAVVIAYSGGADSSALLEFFCENRGQLSLSNIIAVHVNHLLRGEEAARDEEFVRNRCASKGIPCVVERRDIRKIAEHSGESLETCGRRIRYEILGNIAERYQAKIATAHTLGDNAETILFRMSRGTGMKGLCGIPPVRENVIRPLIFCTRQDIEEYLKQRGVSYCTDSTNFETDYARNRIRQEVIPALEQINPAAQKNIVQMSRQLQAEEEFLQELCGQQIEKMKTAFGYDCHEFPRLHVAMQSRVAYSLCKERVPSIDEKRVELLCAAMRSGRGEIRLNQRFCAKISHFLLTFEEGIEENHRKQIVPLQQLLEINEESSLHAAVIAIQDGENFKKIHKNLLKRTLDYDRIIGNAVLRHRQPLDKIRLANRGMTKTLKKLFSEEKIPLQIRDSLFVLADAQGVIWVEGFGCDERVALTQDTKRVLCFTDTIQESR